MSSIEKRALDRFGEIVSIDLRDAALRRAEAVLRVQSKAPGLQALQDQLASLSPAQTTAVLALVRSSVECGIHDFLFKLQELTDLDQGIAVLVDGVNVAAASDGLQGEPYSDTGWYARFSRFPNG